MKLKTLKVERMWIRKKRFNPRNYNERIVDEPEKIY